MRRAARLIVDHTLGDFVTYLVTMVLLFDDSKTGRARARRVVRGLRLRTKVMGAVVVGLPSPP